MVRMDVDLASPGLHQGGECKAGGVGVGVGYHGIYIGSVSGTTTAPGYSGGDVWGIADDVGNRAMWVKNLTTSGITTHQPIQLQMWAARSLVARLDRAQFSWE
jgi:hypothetical protein